MALSQKQKREIKQLANNLRERADNLSHSPPSPTIINILPYDISKKVTLWLLEEKSSIGRKVENDFNTLDQTHAEYESWRYKVVSKDNEEEFQIVVDCLVWTLNDLADTLDFVTDKKKKKKVGRPPNPKIARRNKKMLEAWETGYYKRYKDLAKAFRLQTADAARKGVRRAKAERDKSVQ